MSNGNSSVVGVEEQRLAILDGVGLGVLEVRVCVDADEIGGCDDSSVGRVDICGPCVDMTDWGSAQNGASQSLFDSIDAAHDGVRAFSWVGLVQDAGGRDAV